MPFFISTHVQINRVTQMANQVINQQTAVLPNLPRSHKKARVPNKPQSFNRIIKHSALKNFLILSFLVTFCSLTIASSREKGLTPSDMRFHAPTQPSAR